MRNLKRALSLALATVMTMGLMMVGSGASYKDVKTSDNVEAIEVLQTVGIMTGDENGNFNPDKTVTRNEMAVIMANLLNLDYDYYRGTNPFTDVPSWAAPYVAACAAEGVVSGIGNNMYGGEGNVTAAQASLMIMKALGYFQYQADFGDDWQVATIRQASYIDLFSNINATAETALTRNQIAQLVLNGLKANMVSFTGDVGTEATIGNTSINIGYRAEYTPKTNANSKYNTIDVGTTNIASDDRYYVQLGEELYNGDLKLKGDFDVFGRPARYWEYDGKEIGTYVNYDLMVKEYTTEVTGKDLYDLLGSSTIKDYDLTVVIDGVSDVDINDAIFTAADMNKNNKQGVGETGNGVLTQVFVDSEDKDIVISVINTYLAIASKDYDEKKDELGVTVYGLDKTGDEYIKAKTSAEDKESFTLDGEDFAIADLVENDALLVTVADGEVQTAVVPEVVSDVEITAFKLGSSVTVDGTKYSYSDAAEYDWEVLDNYTSTANGSNLKDLTYNVYLDSYGYAIGVNLVETPNNYVFITGVDSSYSNLSTKNVDAAAIFIDGTMKTIKVNTSKSTGLTGGATVNSWFTYTVSNDDVYTVKQVADVANGDSYVPGGTNNTTKVAQFANDTWNTTIDKKNISLPGGGTGSYNRVYGNDATVYLTASIKEIATSSGRTDIIIDDVDSVTTGIKNANIDPWNANGTELNKAEQTILSINSTTQSSGVYTLYKSNGYIIATVVVGEDAAASKNLVYVHSSNVEQEGYDKTADEWTWTRKVISNGQEVTLTEVGDSLTYIGNASAGEGKMAQYGWYQVKYNAEGEVIGVEAVATALDRATGNNVALGQTGDYVDDIQYLVASINEEDTVLYSQSFTNDHPTMKVQTLYVTSTTNADNGFFVDENVNVALIQWVKNKQETTFYTGSDDLEDIVNDLNEKNGNYNYQISAILEDGAATSVVIYDMTNTYATPNTQVKADDYSIDYTGTTINQVVYYKDAAHDDGDILDVIVNDLTAKGYKNFKLSHNASGYVITCTDTRGIEWSFTWNEAAANAKVAGLKIKMDNKGILVANNTQIDAIAGWVGPHAKVTFADKTVKYADYNWSVTYNGGDNWDGAVIETGYYQLGNVTVTGPFAGWTVATTTPAQSEGNRYVKAGDKVVFTLEDTNQTAATDYAWFSGYTFSMTTPNDATVKAELTTPGTATSEAIVTVTVTLNTVSEGMNITVNTAANP